MIRQSMRGARLNPANGLELQGEGGAGTVGRRMRTDALVQRKSAGAQREAAPAPTPQREASEPPAGDDPFALHLVGPSAPLPHAQTIQRSFGRHDVSGIQAHVGGAAAVAADRMGAVAYASGGTVGFREEPDLHTAAHEAAHVVQQAGGGVQLKGGIGEAGDPWERHADAVADAVVAGRSAEALLDAVSPAGGAPAATGGAVQRIKDYKAVSGEMLESTWEKVALDPKVFIEKRVPKLVAENASKRYFVLHRGQAKSEGLERIKFDAQDFPATYYSATTKLGEEVHVFGLHGEDWFRQMLYILGVLQVPEEQVLDNVEHHRKLALASTGEKEGEGDEPKPEDFDVPSLVAKDLGPTLEKYKFATTTIGMKGRIRLAVERVLTKQAEPTVKEREAEAALQKIKIFAAEQENKAKLFDPGKALLSLQRNGDELKKVELSKREWWLDLQQRASKLGEMDDASGLISELGNKDKKIGSKIKDLKDLRTAIDEVIQSIDESVKRLEVTVDEDSEATPQLEKLFTSTTMQSPLAKELREAQSMVDAEYYVKEYMTATSEKESAVQQLANVKKAGRLGKHTTVMKLISAAENARVQSTDLEMKVAQCKASVIQHDVLTTGTGDHLLVNIADAHGDMAYHVTKAITDKQPDAVFNLLGTAGSLDGKEIPPGTMVAPEGVMTSIEPGRDQVKLDNAVKMEGATYVKNHTNVSTLLREHDNGVEQMSKLHARTMDMESYHVVRALEELKKKPELRILFRVSDVANSKEMGAQRERKTVEKEKLQQDLNEESAAVAMGLVKAPLK